MATREMYSAEDRGASAAAATTSNTVPATTLGTNVQVAGVDELDFVKADGKLIYDLDGKGTSASPTPRR